MSLYIGKDNINNSIIHITSNSESLSNLKNTNRLPSTTFLSTLPIPEIVYTEYATIPNSTSTLAGSVNLSSAIKYYMDNPAYYVLQYVLADGYCYESLLRKVFIFGRENGSKYICNLDNSNNGKTILFIVTQISSFPNGPISISNSNILIGNTSISTKKWLMYNTYYSSEYFTSYLLTNGTYMSIVDSSGSSGFKFSKDKIQYVKGGGTYDLISTSTLSRANAYVVSSSNSSLSGTGISCYLPLINNTVLQTVVIKIPLLMFYIAYYGGGKDINIGISFDMCVKSNEDMKVVLNFVPYALLYISWSSYSKLFSINIAEQTSEIGAEYIGGNKILNYYSV